MEWLLAGCVVCRTRGAALCRACLRRAQPPPSTQLREVGRVHALFAYEGHGARIVQSLKYRDGRRLVGPLADLLAGTVAAQADGAAVTWVPTSGARRRDRGFDQSELLARAVARRLGIRAVPLLRRRPGPPQTGLGRDARAASAGYVAVPRSQGEVILLDDVCTTGATLRTARRALADQGVGVRANLVVARTP